MVLSTLLRFIYPPPASWFINSMSVITGAILLNGGLMEVKGKSMQYSKFFNTNKKNVEASGTKITELSGRNGMLVAYAPAFVASVISLAFMRDGGLRFTLLTSALTVHFFKRLFELFLVYGYCDLLSSAFSSRIPGASNRSEIRWNSHFLSRNNWEFLSPLPAIQAKKRGGETVQDSSRRNNKKRTVSNASKKKAAAADKRGDKYDVAAIAKICSSASSDNLSAED
ncbi:hypothetical protein ACET3Z_006506 [Daucus carota]